MSSAGTPPDQQAPDARVARPGGSGASSRGGRNLAGTVAVVALLVVALASLPWFVSSDSSTAAFDATNLTRAEIEVNGRATVRSGQPTQAVFDRQWRLGQPTTQARVTNGVLQVSGRCSRLWLLGRCRTDVDVTVPAGTEVVVTTSAGGINVAGITGGVDLRSSAGAVEVRDVAGPARLHSSAGAIQGTMTGGDVEADSSAGGVTLTLTGPFQRLSATSSAGGIDLTVPDQPYRVDADTSAGSVDLGVRTDPNSPREIFARSSAGSIIIRPGGSG